MLRTQRQAYVLSAPGTPEGDDWAVLAGADLAHLSGCACCRLRGKGPALAMFRAGRAHGPLRGAVRGTAAEAPPSLAALASLRRRRMRLAGASAQVHADVWSVSDDPLTALDPRAIAKQQSSRKARRVISRTLRALATLVLNVLAVYYCVWALKNMRKDSAPRWFRVEPSTLSFKFITTCNMLVTCKLYAQHT